MKEKSHTLFGEMLIQDGVISKDQLEEALEIQKKQSSSGESSRVGVILIELGYLDKSILEEYINRVIASYTT